MGRQMIFWLLAPFFQWIEYSRLYKNKTFIPKPRSSSLEGLFNKGSLVNLLFNCLHNATVLHIYFMIFSFKFQTIFKQSTCTMHIFWSQLNIDLFQVSNNLWSGLGFPEFLFCPVEYCSSRADPSVKVQSSNLAILKRDGKGMDNFFFWKNALQLQLNGFISCNLIEFLIQKFILLILLNSEECRRIEFWNVFKKCRSHIENLKIIHYL